MDTCDLSPQTDNKIECGGHAYDYSHVCFTLLCRSSGLQCSFKWISILSWRLLHVGAYVFSTPEATRVPLEAWDPYSFLCVLCSPPLRNKLVQGRMHHVYPHYRGPVFLDMLAHRWKGSPLRTLAEYADAPRLQVYGEVHARKSQHVPHGA